MPSSEKTPLLNGARTRGSPSADGRNDGSSPQKPSAVRVSVDSASSPTAAFPPGVASARQLLLIILTLSGPISLTTVVEFLPQILISAMVGHSNPRTALDLHDDGWTSDSAGALLETYGLASLVYSTAAFSLVYGFICGLDSVASCSYGMTVDASAGGRTEDSSGATTASATPLLQEPPVCTSTVSNGTGSRSRSPLRVVPRSALVRKVPLPAAVPTDPKHGQGGISALRTQPRTVSWASPPLRGLGAITMSPVLTGMSDHKGGKRSSQQTKRSSHHLETAHANGLTLQRSPSAPITCDPADNATLQRNGTRTICGYGSMPTGGLSVPMDIPASNGTGIKRPIAVASSLPHHHYGSFPPPDIHGSTLGGVWEQSTYEDDELNQLNKRAHNAPRGEQALRSNHSSTETSPALHSAQATAATTAHSGMASLTLPPPVASWPILSSPTSSGGSSPMTQLELGQAADPSALLSSSPRSDSGTAPRASPSSPQPSSSLIGTWIARCLMLELVVVAVLIVLLHWGTEPLLRALGEPAESIPVASAYVTAASFGLPFVAVYHALNKGLQSSGVVMPVLVISVVTKTLCLLAVYVALYHLAANLVAVAWIMSAAMLFQAAAVYVYMRYTGIAESWWGRGGAPIVGGGDASSSIFSWAGIYEYCVLGLPACVAICLEFWLFDLLGALAGLLPDPSTELAVHYLLFTTTLASYMIFSGLSVSVSVLVGQRLGCAGQSGNAKKSAILGTSACLCVSACLMVFIAFFHETLARGLTSQPLLLARFAECVPVLVAYQAVDGLNTCSTQLLRTLGVQKYGVLLHFTTYYLIGMSASCFLAFACGFGVLGLWVGLCIGVGLNASIATVWLWRYADWEDQSAAAQSRAVALCGPCDSPSAFLSSSDAFVSAAELGQQPDCNVRTSLHSMQHEDANAHQEHHGN